MPATRDAIIAAATTARRTMTLDELATAAGLVKAERWTYFYVTNEATIAALTGMTADLAAENQPDFAGPIGYAYQIAAKAQTIRNLAAAERAMKDEAEVDRY